MPISVRMVNEMANLTSQVCLSKKLAEFESLIRKAPYASSLLKMSAENCFILFLHMLAKN